MGRRILVIDDDDRSGRLARDILAHRGHAVMLAGGGAQGVALARAVRPDLVLLDIQMPVLDGFGTRAALAEAGLGDVPVIAVTAAVRPEDRERIVRAGFAGRIDKPITVRTLLDAVEAAFGGPAG